MKTMIVAMNVLALAAAATAEVGNLEYVILNDKGEKVYSSTLEYGWGFTCTHTWRVPADLKGQFTAVMTFSAEPFKVLTEKTAFTIE